MADRFWVGGIGVWSDDTNHWATSSGGSPGAGNLPTSSDDCIFDGSSGTGTCTLDQNIDVRKINISTVNIAVLAVTYNVVIGAGGLTISNGAFNGGSGSLTINKLFNLSGGSFTATSGITQIGTTEAYAAQTLFTVSGGTYNHNSGTLKFYSISTSDYPGRVHTIDLTSGTVTVFNLIFDGGNAYAGQYQPIFYTLGASDIFEVEGNLTFKADMTFNTAALTRLNGGTISIVGNITIGAGAYGGSTIIDMDGAVNATYAYSTGAYVVATTPSLNIKKSNNTKTVTPFTGTTAFAANKFIITSGAFTAPSGTFRMGIDYRDANVPGNDEPFLYSGGIFTHNSGTVEFYSCSTYNVSDKLSYLTLTAGDITFNNLTFWGGYGYPGYTPIEDWKCHYTIATNDIILDGNLLMKGDVAKLPEVGIYVDGREILVAGNITVEAGIYGGTTKITADGTVNKTVSQTTGTFPTGVFTIAKTSGSKIMMITDFTLNALTVNSGATFDKNHFTLTVTTLVNNGTIIDGAVISTSLNYARGSRRGRVKIHG